MSIPNFFKFLTSTSTRRPPIRRTPTVSRLSIEDLEERTVPAFLAPVDYPVGGSPQAVVTGDFNNDTRLDLAVGSGNAVSVLLGNGDGTFQAAVSSGVSFPDSIAVGDFNNDGVLDLATTNHDAVNVLLGNGDGSFRPPSFLNIGYDSTPHSVAVGDFTGDGNLDLEVLSNVLVVDDANPDDPGHWEGRAEVLPGDGTGSFGAPVASSLGLRYFTDAAVADFDGDGKDDVAATDNHSTLGVFLAKSDGSGILLPSAAYTTGVYLRSVRVADVNGDGIGDLVTGNDWSVSVLLGNGRAGVGDGTFQAAQTTALDFYFTYLAVGDFNADGNLDLGTASNVFVVDYTNPNDPDDYYGHYECEAKVLLGNGTGQFAAPETTELGVGELRGIVSGHFDRDAFADLAVTNTVVNAFVPFKVSVLLDDQSWMPPPPPPAITVGGATVTEGNSDTRVAAFPVTLDVPSGQTITVAYITEDGTATAGSDYQAVSGTLTFAPGETSKTVTVPVLGDRLGEADETFSLTLGSPTNATVADGQGAGTILDDEPRVGVSDVSKKEGNGGTTLFVFTVTLSVAYDVPVTVNFATADGTAAAGEDYEAASGTVTFAPGETSKTVTVRVKGDKKKEADEWFSLDLRGATNAVLVDARGVGSILNDDR
jgi:hypothetical protein